MNKFYSEVVEFIRSLFNKPTGFIPIHEPRFIGNEKNYLNECIDSTYVSSIGKFVDIFEDKIAEYTRSKKAVACVNGTSALHLALLLVGVKPNDEVITQPLTFIATANAISYCGAHPIFVDVDRETLGLSPETLNSFLSKNAIKKTDGCYNRLTGRRISAVVPMHTFGHPCKIDEIADICKQYQIELIEDAAESLGSWYKDKHTGTFGSVGVLSFNGNKVITTGGGGVLLINNYELAQKAKHLSTQAKTPHPWKFYHDYIGYNYRMPNINAALGVAQLEQIEKFLVIKRNLADVYQEFFSNTPFEFIKEPTNSRSNYWLNTILMSNRNQRDEFLRFTNEHGVMTRPAWELISRLPMFKDCQTYSLTNSEWLADRIVNIPSSIIMDLQSE